MIASLTATAVAITLGFPIFALGERIRERGERSSRPLNTSPTRKDIS
jgi:hypothetical protein